MFGFMAKVVVGGIGMYAVSKLLERTQVLEKVVETADRWLTQFATNEEFQRLAEQFKEQNNDK